MSATTLPLLLTLVATAAPGELRLQAPFVAALLERPHAQAPLLRATAGAAAPAPEASGFDFDLLGAPEQGPAAFDTEAVELRRSMLRAHQALGVGLMAVEVSALVLGQLDYRDRFGGGDRSGRFKRPHAALGYTAFALFLTNETLALLAPVPIEKPSQGLDRATVHKIGLFTAAAGTLAGAGLGVYSARFAPPDQRPTLAKAHLAVGYATYLAMAVGVGAFVF